MRFAHLDRLPSSVGSSNAVGLRAEYPWRKALIHLLTYLSQRLSDVVGVRDDVNLLVFSVKLHFVESDWLIGTQQSNRRQCCERSACDRTM